MIQLFINTGNLDTLLTKMENVLSKGAIYDKAIRTASTNMLGDFVQRIHVDGKASDGTEIGKYGTKPIYINPINSPQKFKPEGKTGKTTFEKTGQPHKTKYFDGGYKAFRETVGQVSDKVVLTLSGGLQNQLSVIPTDNGYGLGWQNEEMFKRANALEIKYGKQIWFPTEEEQTYASGTVDKIISDALSR